MLYSLYFVTIIAVIFLYFTTLFLIAQKLKNNSIVDIGWGFGYVLVAIASILFTLFTGMAGGLDLFKLISAFLMIGWGMRLSTYLFFRNRKKTEDYRYQNMRKKWGNKQVSKAFVNVFMVQAGFTFIIAAPIYFAFMNNAQAVDNIMTMKVFIPLILGVLIFITGFIFQAVSDHQLKRFIRTRKNREEIMDRGLWKYSRHPNYFGESLMWWGQFIIVMLNVNYLGLIAILSPITITLMLLFVSGVPLLEKSYTNNPAYQVYKQKTPVFFPWFPKK